MHGDISRHHFDPNKNYASVRGQQGRAQLDADQNENTDIQVHDRRAGRSDMIGLSGAPEGNAGMEIVSTGSGLTIKPGRYYVDGIRCDHQAAAAGVPFNSQPHVPGASLPTSDGLYLIYLDVWERPINAVQDPSVREVALGGPDTTTRNQVVWQVRALPVTTSSADPHCMLDFPEWNRLLQGPTGTLEVRLAAPGPSTNPCVVPETAGLRSTENQNYRFEVHNGNFDPRAAGGISVGARSTFKWSRDNGAVIADWREHPSALEIVVERMGPGGSAGFEVGDWVELRGDHEDLTLSPGIFARIAQVRGVSLLLDDPDGTLVTRLSPAPKSSATRHTLARRWETPTGARATATLPAETDVVGTNWIRIEDGIEVRFGTGTFRSGDFWLLPTRTAALPGTESRQIEWPEVGGAPVALRPFGYAHHYARLALVERRAGVWLKPEDCRQLFPPLTELVHLDMLGGDGQHAGSGDWLPCPLRVGVSRGTAAVAGARVRFSLLPFANVLRGALSATEPNATGGGVTTTDTIEVETDASGSAQVWWRLGPGPVRAEPPGDLYDPSIAQQVAATLLDHASTPVHLTAHFTAQTLDNMTLVPVGGNAQFGRPGETLELALRVRVTDGTRPVPNAHVRFSNLNRLLNSAPLDEFSGGSIHASSNVVSITSWPGGSRTLEATVQTDADGIAQVQWALGTATGLPVQRVEAYLLNGGLRTKQWTLFHAQLAIASQVHWEPCRHLLPRLRGEQDFHVQAGLDALCAAIEDQKKATELLWGLIQAILRAQGQPGGGGIIRDPGRGFRLGSVELPPGIDRAVIEALLNGPEELFKLPRQP